jgi:hypothetical protein
MSDENFHPVPAGMLSVVSACRLFLKHKDATAIILSTTGNERLLEQIKKEKLPEHADPKLADALVGVEIIIDANMEDNRGGVRFANGDEIRASVTLS